MKKSFHITYPFFILSAFILICISGCQRDELCFLHPENALIELNIDWSRSKLAPNSASAILYKDGNYYSTEVFSVYPPTHKIVDLPVGKYNMVVINEQQYEFEKGLSFNGKNQWETFEVKTLDDVRYNYSADGSFKLEVDTMATDRIIGFEVTPEMINHTHIYPISKKEAVNWQEVSQSLTFIPRRTFTAVSLTLNVRNGEGYYFATRNPPTLSGMSASYFPGANVYSSTPVTYPVSFTSKKQSDESEKKTLVATLHVISPADRNTALIANHSETYKLTLPFVYPEGIIYKEINLKKEATQFLFTEEDPDDPTNNWDKLEIKAEIELPKLVLVGNMDVGVEDWTDVDIPLDGPQRLHFVANNGTTDAFWWSNLPGVTVNLPDPLFGTAEGLRFKEWNSKSDGTGSTFFPGDSYKMTQGGTIFYAIWEMIK